MPAPPPGSHKTTTFWCTACHWLELLPGQACCLKPVFRMSPELPPLCPEPGPRLPRKLRFGAHSLHRQGGAAAPTPDAGHALLDANTPPFPRAQRHTRLALQPNSRQADLYEYVQGPGILARLPHSIRSIIGGGCATALPEKLGVLRELFQVLITAVQIALG
uniref:Uncharacterized protein n=1 Tax=Rousettus aegyptiacus TaxID=9407 RepID=A0A7J8CHZ6_ROUAE|nr:hypothetical protein HJG63_009036 [Rousettus aegyptiacus]